MQQIPDTMQAAAIDQFGDIDELTPHTLPVPKIRSDEVLIRVDTADISFGTKYEIQGVFAEMNDTTPVFSYIPGSAGAGTIVRVAKNVSRFAEGDKVYGYRTRNPKTKFYAEYTVATTDEVVRVPGTLSLQEAGAMPTDAITTLTGLDQVLGLQSGESMLIFGASGGVGHLGVQLAKQMGARVFAVASGADGVKFIRKMGADAVTNGYEDDVIKAAQDFAPGGFDCALLAAGGELAEQTLTTVRKGGRVAYPNGVQPEPEAPKAVKIQAYNGQATPACFEKLNQLIEAGPFQVHIDESFPLEKAVEAFQRLEGHVLGKIALMVDN